MSEKTRLKRAIENLNAELDEISSSIGVLAGRTEGFGEKLKTECNELEERLEKVERVVEDMTSKVNDGKNKSPRKK